MLTCIRKIGYSSTMAGWRWLVFVLSLSSGFHLSVAIAAESAWTAVISKDPLSLQRRCLMQSETVIASDGYDKTPILLIFDGSRLLVVTESILDISFADIHLVVDDEPSFRSDQLAPNKMFLIFNQDISTLVEQFRAGGEVTVFLRFWPTWPVTKLFPITFSLRGFSAAHDRLKRGCES